MIKRTLLGVSLFSNSGDLFVKKVTAWKMKSIYHDGKPEEKN